MKFLIAQETEMKTTAPVIQTKGPKPLTKVRVILTKVPVILVGPVTPTKMTRDERTNLAETTVTTNLQMRSR